MKHLKFLPLGLLFLLMFCPEDFLYAQQPVKTGLSQVPITYPGDTETTMKRRMQWIEGAKKEGALDWWGILKPDQGYKLIGEFNKIYPFIKGNYWRGKGEEVATKIESEYAGNRYSVDIALGGEPYNFPRWRKMGMLDKLVEVVPRIDKIPRAMYGKYGDWIQPGHSPKVIQYNTRLISAAEAPKNWEDLLNPRWKGQIALQPDMNIWNIFALGEGGWGVEKTEDFLRKIKQQEIMWASGATAGHSLLIAGEYKIFGDSNLRNYLLVQGKNAPVEWVRSRPVPVSGPSMILMRKAPHPNAAKLFVEWFMSAKGLESYEEITGFGAVFPGSETRLAKVLEGLDIVYRTEEVEFKAIEMGLSEKFAKIIGAAIQ